MNSKKEKEKMLTQKGHHQKGTYDIMSKHAPCSL